MELSAYLLYFLMILLGMVCKRSKIVSLLLLAYIWGLIGLNTYTPDYSEYERIYNTAGNVTTNTEIGFIYICMLIRNLGFSYQEFRMIWGMIYVILVANFTMRNTKNFNYVFSLLLISPVLMDVSGIRAGVAYLLAMNFSLLLRQPKKYNKILFALGIVLSSLLHGSAVFYMVFLLADKIMNKRKILLIGISISAITLFCYTPVFQWGMEFIYNITGVYKISKWVLSADAIRPTLIGFLSVSLFLIVLAYLSYKEDKYICSKTEKLAIHKNAQQLLKNACILMLFLLPVLAMVLEARRVFNGSLIIYACMSANCLSEKKSNRFIFHISFKSLKYAILHITLVIGVLLMYMYTYQSYDVMGTLYNNMLFGGV